ncbi:carboxylesterase family protein [Rhodococcus opacus]|uniref:carboxylesterase family protein n=1 Tax=Rhodococcus opacus TaxID=37919 RepID=UPI001FF25080|nr:carboxylesterase family protein [Rhodococcus opacus]UOT03266.1 carboxylesterase family protein [Rhodococcus opacus]
MWRPVLDGRTLSTTPIRALATGAAAGIPVIAGITCNEAGSYTLSDPTAPDQAFAVLESVFGADAGRVWDHYAAVLPAADTAAIGCAILSDERYGVPTRHLLDAQSRHAPVWRYRFDAPSPGAPADKSGFHGADIPFVWNVAMDTATDQQRHLSTEMRRRWVAFITTGTPNLDDLEPWAPAGADAVQRYRDATADALVRVGIARDDALTLLVFAALDGLVFQQIAIGDVGATEHALGKLRQILAGAR